MDIKPWHIIAIGIVAQFVKEIIFPSEYALDSIIKYPEMYLSLSSAFSLFIDIAVLGGLFALLLSYEKTRKLGALLCRPTAQ